VRGDQLFVNLYAQSETAATVASQKVRLTQTTDYPWSGAVTLRVKPEKPATFSLGLRLPGWAQGKPLPSDLYAYDDPAPVKWSLRVNGETIAAEPRLGFLVIQREWRDGDTVALDLPMPVRRVSGHPNIAATRNRVALERGPVVYAFEGVDNDEAVFDSVLPASARISVELRRELLGGIAALRVEQAQRAARNDSGDTVTRPASLVAIPYALWANRGLSPMTVWVPRDAAHARLAPRPTLASRARIATSFHRNGMDPARLNDQLLPRNATDGFAPNFDFWPHKGSAEWVAYELAEPARVQRVTVSWFDDTGSGECRLPVSWRVLYRTEAGAWQPVAGVGEYPIRKNDPVEVRFEPVTTKALRLEVQLPPNYSSGLYEWEVE